MPIMRNMNLINVHFWTYLSRSGFLVSLRVFRAKRQYLLAVKVLFSVAQDEI